MAGMNYSSHSFRVVIVIEVLLLSIASPSLGIYAFVCDRYCPHTTPITVELERWCCGTPVYITESNDSYTSTQNCTRVLGNSQWAYDCYADLGVSGCYNGVWGYIYEVDQCPDDPCPDCEMKMATALYGVVDCCGEQAEVYLDDCDWGWSNPDCYEISVIGSEQFRCDYDGGIEGCYDNFSYTKYSTGNCY